MNEDKVQCQICKKWFKQLTGTHLKNKHNITFEKYKEMFPDAETHPQWLRDKLIDENIKKWSDPKYKERTAKTISDVNKVVMADPVIKQKMIDGSARRWSNEDERERQRQVLLNQWKDDDFKKLQHEKGINEKWSLERRISQSCRLLGIDRDEWDGFGASYCELWCEDLREYIRDKYNRVCFICGRTEEENGQKLDVHHVDYNKQCDCDGTECKLVPLCRSCHGHTTFGDREMWEDKIMKMLEDGDI